MKLHCESLNKEFNSKADLFSALKANEEKLINWKKSRIYKSFDKGQFSNVNFKLKNESETKAVSGFNFEDGFAYPVINTTNYLDSHEDVHFPGIWKKTTKDQQGKIDYVDSHSPKISDLIVWRKNIEVFTMSIPWSLVGKSYDGNTEALIFKFLESNIVNESALTAIKEKYEVQGSVAMQYVKITLAINSAEKKYTDNKKYFDSKIYLIANKEEAVEKGYFFGVEEAKIVGEGSMVLRGSNDATEFIYPENKYEEPSPDTQNENNEEPEKSTLNYQKLISYLK